MVQALNFYMDESGSRNPNHNISAHSNQKNDFFAFGGVLIKDEEESEARELYKDFCEKWKIEYPLHSTEIRHRSKKFSWIGRLPKDEQNIFYSELGEFLLELPVIGIACVVDRPGYNQRYNHYGSEKWLLCKTAFNICVERALKFALSESRKLRIFPERCSKKEDRRLHTYYSFLKSYGLPFDAKNSKGYSPLRAVDFETTLYDFKTKKKSSPLAQVADLYLWPMGLSGYNKGYEPYRLLREHGKLIDCYLDSAEVGSGGIKYSCFDGPRNSKPPMEDHPGACAANLR